MQHHITVIKKDSKSWLAFFIIGIIFVSMAGYSLFHPFAKDISISRVFGLLALLTGTIKVIFSNKHKQALPYWKRHVVIGIFDILMGIFLLSFHGIFTLVLPFILSFWILSGGITVVEEATDIKLFHTSDIDWMFIGGILTIVSLFIVAYLPLLGLLTAMLATTIFLIIIGLFYILLSWRLKSIRKQLHNEEIDLKLLN